MTTAALPLTDQQRAALEAGPRSVSLSAGAGCGKTLVLTERFLAHVDPTQAEPGGLEELVAITFTDAAARQMRDRIRRRCFERLQAAADPAEAAAWQRLMRSMDAARISTIHSFCTQILRTYAVEAGLDPQFDVLDAAAAELLKLETVDDRLRALLTAGDESALELAATRGLERLRSDVAGLAGPRSAPAIARWRDATPGDLVAAWRTFFDEEAAPLALRAILDGDEVGALRRMLDHSLVATPRMKTRINELLATLDGKADAGTLEALRGLAMVQGVCAKKDWVDAADYEGYRDACKALRDRIDKSLFKKPFDAAAAHHAAAQGLALLRLVDDVSDALSAAKARRNQLEFDDLLARAHALLADPAQESVRREVQRTTRLLMIDEFQDTNPLQMSIVEAFAGEGWRDEGLFAVGDFKQSIYRFNGAEPEVSRRLRAALPEEGRLSLTRNFRSQPAITDFVNAVFHSALVDYEPLAPARPQATATPAVELLWTPPDDADPHAAGAGGARAAAGGRKPAGAVRDARIKEAQWIARRIAALVRSEAPIVVDHAAGQPRPVRPGDVAILLRTLSDAQVYEEALREYGLDYYLAGGHAFYSQQEIYDVLNLLSAVASSIDEIALAGALRSPMFSLADETLYWLVQRHGSLNAALAAQPPIELSAGEAAKVRRAAATIARLRLEKDRLLVADLFALMLELTGYDATLLVEFLGPRKAANIEKLVEQARALDRTAPGDLRGFITQLSEFVLQAPKESLAATQTEGDVVRIMTIHYAKGLEFPVVVLPDLDRGRHGGAVRPVLDDRLGPLVNLPGDDLDEPRGSIGIDLYRFREDLEENEERKRLLYVACTRAADYLVLSSSLADPEKPKQDWLKLVNRTVGLADGRLRIPLPAGYAPPEVLITDERPPLEGDAAARSRGADLSRLVEKTRKLAATTPPALPSTCDRIAVDVGARRRFSFSQLTGGLTLDEDDSPESDPGAEAPPAVSSAADGPHVDGRVLGALVQAVLERIDVRRQEGVADLCQYLAPQFSLVQPAEAAAAAATAVEQFLRTPRAAELAAAKVVRREVEFMLPWTAGAGGFAGRYLHGFIDCLYQDMHGRWRLLDYKSNRAAAGDVPQLVRRYELQMLVYSLACERALGAPLAECTLVLLDPGTEHSFVWDAAARQRGIARLDAAIESLASGSAAALD
jgi:ATP-dependent helicase/nuclease subunit A